MADIKVVVDSSDLQLLKRELLDIPKKAKDSASVFEREFRKVETQLDRTAKEAQRYYTEVLKLNNTNKSAAASASVFERVLDREAKTLNSLRASIDPVYRSKQRTIQVTQALRRAVDQEQMSVSEAANTLRLYREQLRATNTAQMASTKSANRMGVVTQQAGYQVSDFIIQVQSGTNPFVAFSQQASQLVGILPLMSTQLGITASAAIALSAGLGIAIPIVGAIGAAFLNFRKAAKESEDQLEDYEKRLKSLDETLKTFLRTQEAARKGFSVDMLLATDELSKAEGELKGYEDRLKSVQELLGRFESLSGPTVGRRAAQEAVSLGQEVNQLEEERLDLNRKIGEAQLRVNLLRQKEQEAINSIIAQESARQRLLEIGLQYGQESSQYREEEIRQKVEALRLSLEEENVHPRVIEFLTQKEASLLRQQQTQETLLDLEEARLSAIELYYDYMERVEESVRSREEGVARIKSLQEGETKSLEQRLALAQVELQFGKDSAEFAAEYARQARIAFANRLAEQGILGNNLEMLMALYDQVIKAESSAKVLSTSSKGTTKVRGTPKREPVDNVKKLQERLELERALLGKTGEALIAEKARQRVLSTLGDQYGKTSAATIKSLQDEIIQIEKIKVAEKERAEELEKVKRRQDQLANTIASGFGDAFMSIVDGTKSAKEAFSDMARHIISRLFEILVIERMVQSIAGAIGGAFSGGSVPRTAVDGTPVPLIRPSSFDGGGYTGSGSRSGGLDGKGGFMAMLHPRETVIDHTKGQQIGTSQPVVINQHFNFTANGDESVKRIIAQQAPKIAQMTQQQILDQRRRGGQMKAAFS